MMAWGMDFAFLAVLAIVTVLAALSGAVRAGVMSVGTVFAGLFAMNYFEPLSDSLVNASGGNALLSRYGDCFALLILFVTGVLGIRMIASRVLREPPELPPLWEPLAAWGCGGFTGAVTAAFLLTAVHTVPGPRDFWGTFPPEVSARSGPITATGPDLHWLGFTQHVSEHVFRVGGGERVFDGPRMTIGEHHDRWPSFTIRYARWRDRLSQE